MRPVKIRGSGLFLLSGALLIAFVTGRRVAEIAGVITSKISDAPLSELQPPDSTWITVSMALMAIFVVAMLRFLILLTQRTICALGQVEARPKEWVSVAMIICGMLCIVLAVALQWHQSARAEITSAPILFRNSSEIPNQDPNSTTTFPSVNTQGKSKQISYPATTLSYEKSSLMVHIITAGSFLVGVVTTFVGLWCCIPAPRTAEAMSEVENEEDAESLNPS